MAEIFKMGDLIVSNIERYEGRVLTGYIGEAVSSGNVYSLRAVWRKKGSMDFEWTIQTQYVSKYTPPLTGDEKVIEHKTKITKSADLLSDRLSLKIEIDEQSRKLFAQYSCPELDLISLDAYQDAKRYAIKSILLSDLDGRPGIFFNKDLIDKGVCVMLTQSDLPDDLDDTFVRIVRKAYKLQKTEVLNVTAKVTTNGTEKTTE